MRYHLNLPLFMVIQGPFKSFHKKEDSKS